MRILRVFTPGTLAWQVAFDLTLSWRRFRSMFAGSRPQIALLVITAALALFHGVGYPVALWVKNAMPGEANERHYYPLLASLFLFVTPWMISQSLTSATRALYTRNDLDLLLASPTPPRTILAARALSIACESMASVFVLLAPVINMCVLFADWRWAALYPALLATGLFAASVGIATALGLFRLAGPRRTRLFSQILATIIGAGFVCFLQALNVVPEHLRESLVTAIETPGGGLLFNKESWLWLPVRAMSGDGPSLALWGVLSVAVFAATAIGMGQRFALSAVTSSGAAALGNRSRRRKVIRFHAGLGRALRHKEWRLLVRDPWLISQIMLQVVYTLPVSIVIWRSQGPNGSLGISVAPAIVVIASQLAASLAWLTVSSEDAPEFLMTAPAPRAAIERRKLEAIAAPLLIVLGVPILALAMSSVLLAAYTAFFAVGAAASTAFLNFWRPIPGRRVAVLRRHSQSKLVAILEHTLALLWAVAMVLGVLDSLYTLIPLALVALILWSNRPRPPVAITLTRNGRPVAVNVQ